MIPIVDLDARIVAWTCETPKQINARVIHSEAQALLRGPLGVAVIEVSAENAMRAGAPANWSKPWRCVAICQENLAQAIASNRGVTPIRLHSE